MLKPTASLAVAAAASLACATVAGAQTPPAPQTAPVAPSSQATPIPVPPPIAPGSAQAAPPAPAVNSSLTQSSQQPPAPSRTVIPSPAAPSGLSEDAYILGAGDQIGIDIFDVPEFSGANGRYTLLIDGSINLPWVGRVMLQGQTLQQASATLTKAYAPYIRNPLVTVSLLGTRSLRVGVVGEVRRPGSYVISPTAQSNQILVGDAAIAGGNTANQWPTITQAIQSAGGITQQADLRKVEIRRPQPDGSLQVVNINLWDLLRSGQINQDITLRDRDTLVIPTASSLSSDEALLIGSSNFAPEKIRINVVGEVKAPGTVEVTPNTSLNQALLTAGGFDRRRARTSRVELIRLNPNGTATRRDVKVDLAAGINEETNPSLRDGDTIVVNRSGLTSFSDTLGTILSPITGFFGGLIGIFR